MDERQSERQATDLDIECYSLGRAAMIRLHDLSTTGCLIETTRNIIPSDYVSLRPSELAPMEGEVIWTTGPCAGVRFFQPIHQVVVDHFGFKPRPPGYPAPVLRDHLDRPLPPSPGPWSNDNCFA